MNPSYYKMLLDAANSSLSMVAKMCKGDKIPVLPARKYERNEVKAMERAEERRKELEHKSEFQETMNRMKIDAILYKKSDEKARLTDHEYLAKKFRAILSEQNKW